MVEQGVSMRLLAVGRLTKMGVTTLYTDAPFLTPLLYSNTDEGVRLENILTPWRDWNTGKYSDILERLEYRKI